ncbi:MAG: 23S rRNA (uracil(1939)-C(5))-methyltransferase RlmD, partial [Bacteroidota bacterium]
RSTAAGEHMVILQVAYDEQRWVDLLLQAIADAVPAAASLNFIINGKRNDTFADLDVITWKGLPWITEKMQRPRGDGELQFRIGPKSFYQTNPRQAEVLYRTAWEFAALTGTELVYDLYTGTGTIANYVAADASKVVGLEYVEAAVEDARINSDLNGTKNTIFQAGDMKNLLTEQFISVHGKPDVVITDPPRAGMHEDVVKMLLSVSPQRIVYVSCNPATQARDLKILSEAYRITAVQPVDMFPQTMHVENVVGLVRR